MEDPGGPTAEVLTTFPPEVLISTNLTNASLLDYPEENTAEIKFYLPVSAEMNTSVSYKYSRSPDTRLVVRLCINTAEQSILNRIQILF